MAATRQMLIFQRGEKTRQRYARRRRGGGAAKIAISSRVGARIFARAEGRYVKSLFLPSLFAKLLEFFSSYFSKSRWMSS
jgi:hypothetical protein